MPNPYKQSQDPLRWALHAQNELYGNTDESQQPENPYDPQKNPQSVVWFMANRIRTTGFACVGNAVSPARKYAVLAATAVVSC